MLCGNSIPVVLASSSLPEVSFVSLGVVAVQVSATAHPARKVVVVVVVIASSEELPRPALERLLER